MRPLLSLSLAVLALASCSSVRPVLPLPIDVPASYRGTPTEAPTLPRALGPRGFAGLPYTPADIAATRALGISVGESQSCITSYFAQLSLISIDPRLPRCVLMHEVGHAGQAAAGVTDKMQQEAVSLLIEVAVLLAEGWPVSRIRALSANNKQTPDWVFAWLVQFGPQFKNNPSDIAIAYQWAGSITAIQFTQGLTK